MYKNEPFANGQIIASSFALHPNINSRFSIRLNTKLESQGYQPMSSLVKDLSDGVRLIQLMVRPPLISWARSHIHAGNHGYVLLVPG